VRASATVTVRDQPARIPRLSVPNDSRPFKLGGLAAVALVGIQSAPPEWRIWLLTPVLLITPAVFSSVAVEGSIRRALNPVRIVTFIYSMGLTYVALRVVVTGTLLLLFALQHYTTVLEPPLGAPLMAIGGVYLLLVMYRATGALLHARRDYLGLKTDFSPEQAAEDNRIRAAQERQAFLKPLMGMCREDQYGEAWQLYGEVMADSNGGYRLDSGEAVIRLADTASNQAERRTIIEAIRHFDDDFPNHPKSRQAFLAGTQLALDTQDLELAQAFFDNVQHRRGVISRKRYDACLKVLGNN